MSKITIDRALLEQALEALEREIDTRRCKESTLRSMNALRGALAQEQAAELSAALGWPGGISEPVLDRGELLRMVATLAQEQAEPVQEPVAWMVYAEGGTSEYVTDNPNDLVGAHRPLPLYTAPPQRKPLTEEEIALIDWESLKTKLDCVRAIERAHGIGGQDAQV